MDAEKSSTLLLGRAGRRARRNTRQTAGAEAAIIGKDEFVARNLKRELRRGRDYEGLEDTPKTRRGV